MSVPSLRQDGGWSGAHMVPRSYLNMSDCHWEMVMVSQVPYYAVLHCQIPFRDLCLIVLFIKSMQHGFECCLLSGTEQHHFFNQIDSPTVVKCLPLIAVTLVLHYSRTCLRTPNYRCWPEVVPPPETGVLLSSLSQCHRMVLQCELRLEVFTCEMDFPTKAAYCLGQICQLPLIVKMCPNAKCNSWLRS